jgi:hypothetical protein
MAIFDVIGSIVTGPPSLHTTGAAKIGYLTQTYNMPALVLAFWRDSFVALSSRHSPQQLPASCWVNT